MNHPFLLPEGQAECDMKYIDIFDNFENGMRTFTTGVLLENEIPSWLKWTSAETNMRNTKIMVSIPSRSAPSTPTQATPSSLPSKPQHALVPDTSPSFHAILHPPDDETRRSAHQPGQRIRPERKARRVSFQPSPVSEPVSQMIKAGMDLPASYTRILHRGLGASMRFASQSGSQGFILQCRPVGDWHFSLAVSTHPAGNSSHVFVHGLQECEFWKLVNELDDVEYHPISAHLIVPLFLIGKRAENAADALQECVISLKKIQQHLDNESPAVATGSSPSLNPTAVKGNDWLFSLDLKKITSDITHLSSELAYHKAESCISVAMLEVLDEICSTARERPENGGLHSNLPLSSYAEKAIMQELSSYFNSMDVEAERYGRSADAQRQTVYALIAQKDNMLNIQVTEASLRIAESSRVESNAMKTIAQSTAHDSASMSVITTITAVFLPATFTATLFSTSFFDFQPSGQGRHVSPWLALYWGITCLLTIFVLGTWKLLERRKKEVIAQTLRCMKESTIPTDIGSRSVSATAPWPTVAVALTSSPRTQYRKRVSNPY